LNLGGSSAATTFRHKAKNPAARAAGILGHCEAVELEQRLLVKCTAANTVPAYSKKARQHLSRHQASLENAS